MQHQVIDPGKDNMGKDIVVAGEGTGIVHMAPGCGDIDHKVGKLKGLINIAPLDEEAKFLKILVGCMVNQRLIKKQ